MGIRTRHMPSLRPFKIIAMSLCIGAFVYTIHTRTILEFRESGSLAAPSSNGVMEEDTKASNMPSFSGQANKPPNTEPPFNMGIAEYNLKKIMHHLNEDKTPIGNPSQASIGRTPTVGSQTLKSNPKTNENDDKYVGRVGDAANIFVQAEDTPKDTKNALNFGSNNFQIRTADTIVGYNTRAGFTRPTDENDTNSNFDQQTWRGKIEASSQSGLKHQCVILLWNAFFTDADFGLELGEKLFRNAKCSQICRLTADKRELPTADAVVVHAFHLLKDLANASIPQRVSRKQIFVFLILENPYRSYPGLFNLVYSYIDLFNLTMTYLDDPTTDIHTPYGALKKRLPPDPFAIPSFSMIRAKTKKVVWIVSNCRAPSARYEYVDLLSKHIQVDIFGKCGEDTCPKGEICLELKDKEYLFYLAFENGYCKDYITEKTFRTLATTNMVPVVLGGGNYTKDLPRHSYIDVRDFNSPEQLAAYLEHLSENRVEYAAYHQWKKDYVVQTTRSIRCRGFCRLCEILHTDNYPYKSRFDPLTYWAANMCLMGDDEREALHIF